MILGFVTPRVGENFSIVLYLLGAIGFQLLFWLVPSFVGSSIAVAFVGFFLGPLFPAAVVALTKLLPKHMHVPAIGFSAAFGGGGACVLPFGVGAIAQRAGVQVLQPVIMAMLVVATLLWAIGMPRIKKGDDDDKLGKMTAAGKRVGRKISRRCAAFV
jgi:fucose permease